MVSCRDAKRTSSETLHLVAQLRADGFNEEVLYQPISPISLNMYKRRKRDMTGAWDGEGDRSGRFFETITTSDTGVTESVIMTTL